MTKGATKQEWARLVGLGLTADLLPVVSDGTVAIHLDSKIKQLGKTPSRISAGMAVGIPKWTLQQSTGAQVKAWAEDDKLGICLQTRAVRALDVDVADPALSAEIRGLVEMLVGGMPCRMRSNSGKLLLAFRMDGEHRKQRMQVAGGVVEFLANGQQFVAAGTHPSGARYEWQNFDADFPVLSADEFAALWKALADAFAVEEVRAVSDTVAHSDSVVGFTEDDIREMLALLDPTMSYDEWLMVGQSIHHETRGAGLHLWDEWSQGGDYPGPDELEYKWSTFGHTSGAVVTGRTLHHMAQAVAATKGVALSVMQAKPEEFPVVGTKDDGSADVPELPAFVRDNKGRIEPTLTNTVQAVRRPDLTDMQVAYDNFRDEITVAPFGQDMAWRPMTDADAVAIRMRLESVGFKAAPKELARDACVLVASENEYDSAQLWLNSIQWDGVPRVERFLVDLMGCEDSPYTRAVALYMWTALAGRVLQPGVKADMVPIYEGDQGLRKSSAIEAISPAPEFFVEIDFDKKEEDTVRTLRGALVGEIAELSGLHTRQVEWIKKFVVRKTEKWIPKFKEFSTTFARRLLFIGTTNRTDILADATGHRRWLPLHITKADVDGIVAAREQLWAEGAALFKANGVMWQKAEELAIHQHDQYTMEDTWESAILAWLNGADDFGDDGVKWMEKPFTTSDVLAGALRLSTKEQDRLAQKRTCEILRAFGFVQKTTRIDGIPTRAWKRNVAGGVRNVEGDAFSVSDFA